MSEESQKLEKHLVTIESQYAWLEGENARLQAEVEQLLRDLTKERETIILLGYLRQGSVGEVWAHYEQQLAEQRAEIERLKSELEIRTAERDRWITRWAAEKVRK